MNKVITLVIIACALALLCVCSSLSLFHKATESDYESGQREARQSELTRQQAQLTEANRNVADAERLA